MLLKRCLAVQNMVARQKMTGQKMESQIDSLALQWISD